MENYFIRHQLPYPDTFIFCCAYTHKDIIVLLRLNVKTNQKMRIKCNYLYFRIPLPGLFFQSIKFLRKKTCPICP